MPVLFDLVGLVLAVQVPRKAYPHAPALSGMFSYGVVTPERMARR
jgi:hypothetical protein